MAQKSDRRRRTRLVFVRLFVLSVLTGKVSVLEDGESNMARAEIYLSPNSLRSTVKFFPHYLISQYTDLSTYW